MVLNFVIIISALYIIDKLYGMKVYFGRLKLITTTPKAHKN